MSDNSRVGADTETPVNPYSLLEAVNRSSDNAHVAWLIFLGIMTFLMIVVAGVTHKDLLLEKAVEVPIVQVAIPLAQFFQFAPVVLLLFHLGVVAQLVLLARKTLEFDQSIRLLEATDRRSHPLRLELHNFFFVQAVAGPHRSVVMSLFLHSISWLTLVILPVILLLYIQLVFLPYHDVAITWVHRVVLVLDVLMLVLIGVFLIRAEPSFVQALARTTTAHPVSFVVTALLMGLTLFFSFCIATVPGEGLDRVTQAFSRERPGPDGQRAYVTGFAVPFLPVGADGSLWGLFHRNLLVMDADLVVDKDVTSDETTLKLRGRNLRYARLDRSDLHQADLTGADLTEASLAGTDLRNARMPCADLTQLFLANRQAAGCTSARGANLVDARLGGAVMTGIDLSEAHLDKADLEAADLSHALLVTAGFTGAQLAKADLGGGAQLQGARFWLATLQGANLANAQLQFADFSSAQLQGASLAGAHLHAAILRDADLEGADMFQARLFGADLTGAKIRAADLRGAIIWMSPPPAQDAVGLSDIADIVVKPLDELDVSELARVVERVPTGPKRDSVKIALAGIMDLPGSRKWAGSNDLKRWQGLAAAATSALQAGASAGSVAESYRAQLTSHLARLMCLARWGNGAVATGIARRSLTQYFKGDLLAIDERLRTPACGASRGIPPKVLRDLQTAADTRRDG